MHEKPRILAVVGPTASGKSALAMTLAKRLDGEIVCCDSMQIYRGMDIGTAKPTSDDRAAIPHHLIDIVDPEDAFSAVDFVAAANRAVADILSRGRLPILCGGTGLYLDAFLRSESVETPGADPAIREELAALAAERGAEYLHGLLAAVDPEAAAATHPNNTRRVIRALELYRTTGVTKTEWDRRSREVPSRFDATVIGLCYQNREILYGRIARRVDEMLQEGLLDEVFALHSRGVFERSPTAAGAIGYKELLPYFAHECTLAEAVEALKVATRRYAKRQMTWFSAKPYIRWLTMDDGESLRNYEEIVNMALELCERPKNML